MTENLLTILHLSDFHFSKRKRREQEIVVDALIDDLTKLCVGHRKPDLVVFSGDLVQAAGEDLHADAFDFLISRVAEATGCSDERLFVVAGNHDVERAGIETRADEMKSWRSLIGMPDENPKFNELYEQKAFDEAINSKFAQYQELESYLRLSSPRKLRLDTSFASVDFIEELKVDLVIFNSSVLSTGGLKAFDKDERRLVIPEYAVLEAVKALTPKSYRVFVTHHPFAMLSEANARILDREFAGHADLHLFGHMHDPQPKEITGLRGKVLSSQAGAIFTARDKYYDGYSLITVDRTNGASETLIRSYFSERSVFDDGIDVVAGGRWYPSQEARQHFRRIAAPINDAPFREHLKGPALQGMLSRESGNGNMGEIYGRFVAPPLRKTFLQDSKADDTPVEVDTPIAFDAFVGDDANAIVYGPAEYGRTTLLRQLRYRLLLDAETIRFARLPAFLDFSDIPPNVEEMARKMRGAAEATPDTNDFESLLSLGHACVLIDDVNFRDRKRMTVLRQFVERFPKARYVFTTPQSASGPMNAVVNPEMPVRFDAVTIRELRRNDMRSLLSQDQRCDDVEMWLDRLQDELREINLPFTAANGSILIEILSQKFNFRPINRAVLMEQFVDSTLRKAEVDQSRRETFDYTNKTDLLAHIAEWMAREDKYVPLKEAVRGEMRRHLDMIGLVADVDDLMAEFLQAKIFVNRSDSRLSFRYRAVLEYFIAHRMAREPSFRAWVLEEGRYLHFVNEIQYYAGKVRNDAELVRIIAERSARIATSALPDLEALDLRLLDTLQLPSGDEDDGDIVPEALTSPPLTREEKDDELDGQLPVDAEDRQEVFRPSINDDQDRFILSLLLYSGLIKNMESIPDAEKRRHLADVLRRWALLMFSSLRLAPRLARERKVRVNGVLYEIQAPQGMSDGALLRQLMVRLPHGMIHTINSTLGTEKLEKQLTEPGLEEADEENVLTLIRTGLVASLRFNATPSLISNLAGRLKDSRFLLWSLIVHVNELRRLDRVKPEHFERLELPLATAISNLKGGSRDDRQKEKDKQLRRLSRDRLFLTLKRQHE
jgi:predicted phosphodiesterase